MEKMTVTEKIGNEYMQWEAGSKVFISAPTGSGKTHFILDKLLSYVAQTNQRILYLVNRTILKEQLNREILLLSSDARWRVQIELYQKIESDILYNRLNELQKLLNEYDYVICDECHYFLADSNYNTNTCLSFQWVQDCFSNKIRVFMSATMKEIREYIEKEDYAARFHRTKIYKVSSGYSISSRLVRRSKNWEYTLERDYGYLNIQIITSRDRIIELVCDSNEKWLVFVDSISFGQELYKKIKKKLRELYKSQEEASARSKDYKKDVVFLSSGYRREGGDQAEEVQVIKNSSMQSARILIATSVLDNGINLRDKRLNNLIVLADNETEFIQMLGRKREDGNRVNLYILKWEKEHFDRRLDQLIRKEQVALEYKNSLHSANIMVSDISGQGKYLDEANKNEEWFVWSQHTRLLNRLLNEENMYEKIKAAFYAKDGRLFLNLLSVYQMDHLKFFYKQMIDNFEEEGEDAFLGEQLRWFGKSEKEIEDMIAQSNFTEEMRIRNEICDMIDAKVDNWMIKQDAVDFKEEIRGKLLELLHLCQDDSSYKNTIQSGLKKNERPISGKNMDYLRENCKLPYRVEKRKGSEKRCQYVFRRAE